MKRSGQSKDPEEGRPRLRRRRGQRRKWRKRKSTLFLNINLSDWAEGRCGCWNGMKNRSEMWPLDSAVTGRPTPSQGKLRRKGRKYKCVQPLPPPRNRPKISPHKRLSPSFPRNSRPKTLHTQISAVASILKIKNDHTQSRVFPPPLPLILKSNPNDVKEEQDKFFFNEVN